MWFIYGWCGVNIIMTFLWWYSKNGLKLSKYCTLIKSILIFWVQHIARFCVHSRYFTSRYQNKGKFDSFKYCRSLHRGITFWCWKYKQVSISSLNQAHIGNASTYLKYNRITKKGWSSHFLKYILLIINQ